MTVEIEAECEAYEQALQRLEQENAQPLSEEVRFRLLSIYITGSEGVLRAPLLLCTQMKGAASAEVLMAPLHRRPEATGSARGTAAH